MPNAKATARSKAVDLLPYVTAIFCVLCDHVLKILKPENNGGLLSLVPLSACWSVLLEATFKSLSLKPMSYFKHIFIFQHPEVGKFLSFLLAQGRSTSQSARYRLNAIRAGHIWNCNETFITIISIDMLYFLPNNYSIITLIIVKLLL